MFGLRSICQVEVTEMKRRYLVMEVDQDVCGLDVAVITARGVNRGERLADLAGDPLGTSQGVEAVERVRPVVEVLGKTVLEDLVIRAHDVGPVRVVQDIDDLDDM